MKVFSIISFLAVVLLAGACSSGNQQQDAEKEKNEAAAPAGGEMMAEGKYICPCGGCPEVVETKAGPCPKCGMDLVLEEEGHEEPDSSHEGHDH